MVLTFLPTNARHWEVKMADKEKASSATDVRFEPITLGTPVTIDGEKHTQITFKRGPKVSDNLRSALGRKNGGTDEQMEVNTVANLCEIKPEVLIQLELNDWLIVQARYMDFLPSYQAPQSSGA
jgi:hypothetical protein